MNDERNVTMVEQDAITSLKEQMLKRRREILELANIHEDEWNALRTREQEMEEQAQKEDLSQELARLEEIERREIEDIDDALRKISLNEYGDCESCGREISLKRLEALPFAKLCARCAKTREASLNKGMDPERDRHTL